MKRLLAVLGAVLFAAGLCAVPASATPPPPLTQRYIISAEGTANCLDVFENPHTGNQIGVSGVCTNVNGGYWSDWNFQIEGSLYEIHPTFDNSVCLTLSTTQLGVSKTEGCVGSGGAPNQLFSDINVANGNYLIWNADLGVYLNDPHVFSGSQHVAGTIRSCSSGINGCTWEQSATP